MEGFSQRSVHERVHDAFLKHIEDYFQKRDLKDTLSAYDENAIGLGSGRGEWALTPEALREIVRRDIQGYPEPVECELREFEIHQVSDEVVVTQALLDFSLVTDTHRMMLRDCRHSIVWRVPGSGDPLICHVHVSFPTDLHGEEEPYPLKELEEISRVVDKMISDRTRGLMDSYQKLEQMVIRDRLTSLYNRVRLNEVLEGELKRANRYDSIFSVLFLDLDHFKKINDTCGHLAGDEILKTVARNMEECVRDTDTVGRWGGEEFMIVMPETGGEEARQVGEKLRKRFSENNFALGDGELRPTVSIGVASHHPGDDLEAIISRVDRALYDAKARGRNRVVTSAEQECTGCF